MKATGLIGLAALTALVTGCPHNEYIVELAPRAKAVERRLIFYRADGTDANGNPNYQAFPTNELAAIAALYPSGAVTSAGEKHTALGQFAGALPADVGGAGSFNHLTTSLGRAGIYVERFRGNDDFSGQIQKRLAAADQLTDLVIGWSRAEFGRERNYANLRRFLDADFRHDLKNAAAYAWSGSVASFRRPEAGEEFVVRFTQYLIERGYANIEDVPALAGFLSGQDDGGMLRLAQRIAAGKLGVVGANSVSNRFAVFASPSALCQSWDNYLAGTKLYRAKLRQWEKERKLRPDLQKPEPSSVIQDNLESLMQPGALDGEDRLTVKLVLPVEPNHTNGKWDETRRQVSWESGLPSSGQTMLLPVFCYASWSDPDEAFQKEHFGRMILRGDELLQYCVWRAGLAAGAGEAWDKFLGDLKPGDDLSTKVDEFRLPSESIENTLLNPGKNLIKAAFQKKP